MDRGSQIQPDRPWYTDISAQKNLSPRCPFASVHRRYYQSVALLGESGISTAIDEEEDQKLLNQWKTSDLWPVVREQETWVSGSSKDPSIFSNFCPEVSFDRFGWFASFLAYYASDLDRATAQRTLERLNISTDDWQWLWSAVTPMHYSDCPLYSPLLIGINEVRSKGPMGFTPQGS